MCLHGTAQSGQLQSMPRSRHDVGKTFMFLDLAMSDTTGDNLWHSSSDTMAGCSNMPSIRASFSLSVKAFTLTATLYGVGRLPSTLALIAP